MNIRYLFIVFFLISLLPGQMVQGAAIKNSQKEDAFHTGRGDTLKYDEGIFDDGLAWYTTSGQTDPHEDSTWGTATYFILDEFGLSDVTLKSVFLCWWGFAKPEYNFRLYVWSNNGSTLEPLSQGPHLYRDLNAELHDVQYEFKEFDLSAQNIALADTFWIGVCGNHFGPDAANADWSLAFHKGTDDNHTLCNDMDDTKEWFPASELSMAKAFGVRVLVEDNVGISKKHILAYSNKTFIASMLNNGKTNIRFTLFKDAKVTILLYDINGRLLNTLISEYLSRGTYNRSFNLGLVPGVYFLSFKSDYGEKVNNKLTIVR